MALKAAVTGEQRRFKTALFLVACAWAGFSPHWFEGLRRFFPAIVLAVLLGGYGLQTVLRDRKKILQNAKPYMAGGLEEVFPTIDIFVAARDEETVIARLVEQLHTLVYPKDKLKVWIIDDGSQDETTNLLSQLQGDFPDLNVINRSRNAGGGKSGALNQALTYANGEWLFILDADAQLQDDTLKRLILFARQGGWSAVQLRKSVVNSRQNLLTLCQSMEMAMDAVIQQGRLATGGVVELRGNGQLIKRSVLEKCGGFNEETVTDDLDLSFRLLTCHAFVGILWDPPVHEEAVLSIHALWRQRLRWAEGGLQRFFDYWPFFLFGQLTLIKRIDLLCFFLLQYALPVISLIDLIASLLTKSMPTYWPLSFVAFSISGLAYWRGCSTKSEGPALPIPNAFSLLVAIIYLAHWFVVIPWVTIKMALFQKNLVWAKTSHQGQQIIKA